MFLRKVPGDPRDRGTTLEGTKWRKLRHEPRAREDNPYEENRVQRNQAPHLEIRQMEIDDLAAVFHLGERLFTSQRVPNLYRM